MKPYPSIVAYAPVPSRSEPLARDQRRRIATSALALCALTPWATGQVGTSYCSPAVPNSSGVPARISALGSSDLAVNQNRLLLRAVDLPVGSFGYFLVGRARAFVSNAGGSQGNLCLGGALGRYVGPGQIQSASVSGAFELLVNLAQTPQGGGFVQVAAGDTFHFQAWFRDQSPAGQSSSNFTDGLEVQFSAGSWTPVAGMLPIPAGTFLMGSAAASGPPYLPSPDEQTTHQVTLSSSFWMGRYEVTQAEYVALMGSNPSAAPNASNPVEQVTWAEARAYCAALTAQEAGNIPPGYEYRLPTEAEWEYCCRAGTVTEYHTGSSLLCVDARFTQSVFQPSPGLCGGTGGPTSVGSYAPNAFGLHEMHGNVQEWCLDSYAPYDAAPVTDPFTTGDSLRVIRGGSFPVSSSRCRSSSRDFWFYFASFDNVGIRVVLAPVLVP